MRDALDKRDIKKLFADTRPDAKADPQKYAEFGYLEFSRSIIERYARNLLGYQNFSIEIIPSNKNTDNCNCDVYWLSNKQCMQIFFKQRPNERYKERISIAEALGLIVLDFIPERLGDDSLLYKGGYPSVAYFAQKILELSAQRDNGSFLRSQYTLRVDDVAGEIRKFHSQDYVQLLSDSQRCNICSKIHDIFSLAPARHLGDGLLSSDIRLILQYIQQKEPYSADNTQQSLSIHTRASDNVSNLIGKLYCYKSGCNIWYPSADKIHSIRTLRNAQNLNPLSAIRLIVAHELGHIVCHRVPGFVGYIGSPEPSSPEEEMEATYFARLLLEHRELMYNNMVMDKRYDHARLEIGRLIRQVYYGRSEEWLAWVLTD